MRFDIIDLRGALTGFTTEEYRLLSAAVVACSNLSYSNMNCKWRIDMNDETTANEQQALETDNTSGTVPEQNLEDENTEVDTPELEASNIGTEQGEDNSVSVPGYNFISIEAV